MNQYLVFELHIADPLLQYLPVDSNMVVSSVTLFGIAAIQLNNNTVVDAFKGAVAEYLTFATKARAPQHPDLLRSSVHMLKLWSIDGTDAEAFQMCDSVSMKYYAYDSMSAASLDCFVQVIIHPADDGGLLTFSSVD